MSQAYGMITNVVNNICHLAWIYVLFPETKYGKKKTLAILCVSFFLYELILMGVSCYLIGNGLFQTGTVERTYAFVAGYIVSAAFTGFVLFCFVSPLHPAKNVFYLSAYASLWTIVYIAISMITGSYSGTGSPVIWALRVALNLLFLIPYLLYVREPLYQTMRQIENGKWLIAILSGLGFCLVSVMLFYNDLMKSHDPIHLMLIISIYVFLVAVYVMISRYISDANASRRLRELQANEKFLRAQIEAYGEMEKNVRQTRHDLRHHNMVVMEYARKKDYQSILSYLEEYEERESAKYQNNEYGSGIIGTILSAYAERCGQNGVSFETDIRAEKAPDIADYDMVTILANILENAVNGSLLADGKPWVSTSIVQKDKKLVIVCRNSCARDANFRDGLAQDANFRDGPAQGRAQEGVGLESIRNAASKYGGDVAFSVKDEVFTCRVILNNKKKPEN